MIFKLFEVLKRVAFSLLICGIGIILLAAPYNPGALSNIMAWLETDGGGVSLSVGSILLLVGIFTFFFSLRSVFGRLHIIHGKLSSFVDQNVIKGIVEQILSEYFEITDLQAHVSLSSGELHLVVEVPEGKVDIAGFTEYLRDRLFLLAGYYGKIYLSEHPKKVSEVFQELA